MAPSGSPFAWSASPRGSCNKAWSGGPDRRTQDGDDTVLIAPVPQHRNKIRQGARVAGFDPQGFPVGGDGPIRIAPGREQVAEQVILPGVTGPAFNVRTGRRDGLVECLQALFTLLSTQKDRAQAPDVPRIPRAAP